MAAFLSRVFYHALAIGWGDQNTAGGWIPQGEPLWLPQQDSGCGWKNRGSQQ